MRLYPSGRFCLFLVLLCAVIVPLAAGVSSAQAKGKETNAAVPESLLEAAKQDQKATFDVLVQGDGSEKSTKLADKLAKMLGKGIDRKALGHQLKAQFASAPSVRVDLSGEDILHLAKQKGLLSIVPNADVELDSLGNAQKWPDAAGVRSYWNSAASSGPAGTIAIIDSGVDTGTGQFGNRVTQFDLGGGFSSGDGRGHGTFVAALAAGAGEYAGVAPSAKIISLDVFDALGNAKSSDVLRATDWILQHRAEYDIRVANFSLLSAQLSSFFYDPLDQAVERLWQAGVVVVCASGNYARDGRPSGVWFPPGNDPFVITVGAVDVRDSTKASDDFNAPWSSYGYTPDGFAKPELGAPGRYMIEQVPADATLLTSFAKNVIGPGKLQLSGTSFSAPVVAGMAAVIVGAHPDWTPDQVKGALMASATPLPKAAVNSVGVGEANLQKALAIASPPNPNEALNRFLVADPAGGELPLFDSVAWTSTARSNPAWNTASWASASWASASWASASWASASWASASWASASWASASWTSASWASASWASASWASASWASASWSNNASADGRGSG